VGRGWAAGSGRARRSGRSLATIFLPLTWQVWLLHVAMMVFGAAAILFMEATGAYLRGGGAGDDADSDSGGGGSEEGGGGGRLSANGLLKSVYAALIHFLWNGPQHDTKTAGGKLALFGLCFHTLIIAASYTASLAGFLSMPSSVPIVVLSFDIIQSSPLSSLAGRLCVLQSAQVSGLNPALDARASSRCALQSAERVQACIHQDEWGTVDLPTSSINLATFYLAPSQPERPAAAFRIDVNLRRPAAVGEIGAG
jgi:hypothetical protein